MTATALALAALLSSQRTPHTCVDATSRSNSADLDKVGTKARLFLRDGKHCVVVILTVSPNRDTWPAGFRVGDFQASKLSRTPTYG